ncbi:hypothetical protein CABS01_15993 [Colletotrichum abscissum]|uniref:uncharacterized protein n=1 Tax=Colletotrichum abscissum TaxID=1671311 RepID=UPI0027D61665|nr:uncharacterized protein CABS01_15993 [Colletotrichum abscissum]KAK1474153.1 hypothetical protein CABS01_15993 [Colletotrichum abscissum]
MADSCIDKTILSPRYKQESSYGLRIALFRRAVIAPCYDAPLATGNGREDAAKRLLGGIQRRILPGCQGAAMQRS